MSFQTTIRGVFKVKGLGYVVYGKVESYNGKFDMPSIAYKVKLSNGFEGESYVQMYGKVNYPIFEGSRIPMSLGQITDPTHIPKVGDVVYGISTHKAGSK